MIGVLRRKKKICARLLILIIKRLLVHQFEKRVRSSGNFTQSSSELITIFIFKSSAKRKYLQKRNTLLRPLLKNYRNNNGDKCPPCGTTNNIKNV